MQFPENSSSGEHGSWEGLRQHQPEVEGWEGSARGAACWKSGKRPGWLQQRPGRKPESAR